MSKASILQALKRGPLTNAQLQEIVRDRGPNIARDCFEMTQTGEVRRVDPRPARGRPAIYALSRAHRERVGGNG